MKKIAPKDEIVNEPTHESEEIESNNSDNEPDNKSASDAPTSDTREINKAASMGGAALISRFALPPNYVDGLAGVKKKIAVVPVSKPKRNAWWMAHPSYLLEAGILNDETPTGKDAYLVSPALVPELGDDVVRTALHGIVTRQGVFMVLPVRMPGADGRLDSWNESMREAIVVSYRQPVRTASNRDGGYYDIYTAPTTIKMPLWPSETWEELLMIGFRDKVIETFDHPVLRRLRGEV